VGRLVLALGIAGCGQQPPGSGEPARIPMREMMQQMMVGVVPSGVTAEDLPDPRSPGAILTVSFCTQCHALPSPRMHAAPEWPAVVARMTERMRMMARMQGMMMGTIRAPTRQQETSLLQYLQEHAMQAAPSAIMESDAPGSPTFLRVCSRCHAPPRSDSAHSSGVAVNRGAQAAESQAWERLS